MTYDQFMAALCIWREARGCSTSQMNAIWWVLQNRANDPANRWPKDIADVVTQPYQFSSFNASDPNVTAWPSFKDKADWLAWLNCQAVVVSPLGGDPTGGATNYLSGDAVPSWAEGKEPTVVLGPFKFYKL